MKTEPTILAVDDSSDSLALQVEILTAAGYQVRSAGSGEMALAAVAASAPDLILLDIRMKGVDGFEVCRQLKAREETRRIPIILVSAFADAKEMVAGLQLGAADYISKPFQAEELLTRVKTHLGLSRANVSLEQQTTALRQANEQLQSEIVKRQRMEDELRQSLDRAERSRLAMLDTLENQKRTEAALQESEKKHRVLIETTATGFVILDAAGRVLDANDEYVRLAGHEKREQILGRSVIEWTAIFDKARNAEEIKKCVASGSVLGLEINYAHSDGTVVPIEVNASTLGTGDGLKIVTLCRDITERKQAEQRLQMFQFATDQADDAMFWMDRHAGFFYVNDQACRSLGYTREELTRLRLFDIDPAYPEERWEADWAQFHEKRIEVQRLESFHRRKDGVIFPIEVVGKQCWFGDTELHVAYVRDITRRKQAAQRIADALNFNQTVLRASPVGIVVFKATGPCISANEAIAQIIGGSREELLKQNFRQLESWKNSGMLAAAEDALATQKERKLETQMLTSFGRKVWCFCRFVPFQYESDLHLLLLLSDVTERKQAEEDLRESEARFHRLSDATFEAVVLHKNGVLLNANDQYFKMFGYNPDELLGKQALPQTVAPEAREHLMKQVESGSLEPYESIGLRKDGTRFPMEIRVREAEHEGQRIRVAAIRDITERKQTEEALRESRKMLRSVLDTIPVRVFWKDLEGRFMGCNQSLARDAGFDSPDELMGKNDYDMAWKAQADLYRADDKAVITSGVPKLQYEELQTTPAGKQMWLRTSKIPLRDLEGRIIGILGTYEDITGRKRAEEEVARTAREWQSTFDATNDAIWILDQNHRILRANKTAETYFQRPYCEMIGKPCWEIVHGTTEPIPECPSVRARQSGHRETMDLQIGERWFEIIVDPILDAAGQYAGAVHIVSDLTARKQAEEALANERMLLRTLVDHLPMAVYLKDLAGRKTLANRMELDYVGATSEAEVLGKMDSDFFPPDQAAGYRAIDEEVIRSGQPALNHESTFTKPDGSVIHLMGSVVPLRDATGRVTGLAGINLDITDRKRAEEALTNERALLRALVDHLPLAVYMGDIDGRRTLANKVELDYVGATSEAEVLGKTAFDIFPPEQAAAYRADDVEVIRSGRPAMNREGSFTKHDGSVVWLLASKVPVRDSAGRVTSLLGINYDITDRKRAEERIRQQAALLDAANDAIYVRDMDHTVTYWNDGAERLYGWTRAEVLGRKITELGEVDHEAFETAHAVLLEQGSWSGELKKTSKAGKPFTVFCRWTLLRDEQNRPKEVLTINTDVTERKQLEANFLRAQRMEGIGALAGGVAHDLNNILQPILMAAPLLSETTGDPESREMLNTITTCAQRGAAIIKQLLTFARGEPGTRVPLPVRHLLSEMDKLIRETFPKNIQLRVNLPKDLWTVLGDPTQIHQAIMNLCVNARDAMPHGGTLTLAAENLTLDEAFASMMPTARPGSYVCVSVTDTGTGIPPEHLERIFDPFFTTKEIGRGTGLGLATVLGIVRGHGGFVRVNSQIDKGTTFELYLPASPETKAAARSRHETLPPRAGGELILVVDDEASVCGVVRRTLEKHGYQVVTAAEGTEAMAFFALHQAEVKAVLTDMMMPGMDGVSLVRALRQLAPRLPILGMTGVGEKADIKGLETLDLLALLTKPFNIAGLLDVLHQALAAPRKKAKGKL